MGATSWTPRHDLGTWHPVGTSWLSRVRVEQRINGTPTGLHFWLPRWRYWVLSALLQTYRLPIAGRLSRALWSRLTVEYVLNIRYSGGEA